MLAYREAARRSGHAPKTLKTSINVHGFIHDTVQSAAELARLNKEIQRLQGEVQRVGGKLSNAAFVDKAPPAVIDKERAKLAEAEQALSKMVEQRGKIAAL